MSELKQAIMKRDDLSEDEAEAEIDMLREEMYQHLEEGNIGEAMDVLDLIGMEPDYLMDLI